MFGKNMRKTSACQGGHVCLFSIHIFPILKNWNEISQGSLY